MISPQFVNNADAASEALGTVLKTPSKECVEETNYDARIESGRKASSSRGLVPQKRLVDCITIEILLAILGFGAEICDGIYYLVDNYLWLHKSGLVKKLWLVDARKYEVRASIAELIGYVFFETPRQVIKLLKLQKEVILLEAKRMKDGDIDADEDNSKKALAVTSKEGSRPYTGTNVLSKLPTRTMKERIEDKKAQQILCALVLVKISADGLLAANTVRGIDNIACP